MRRLLLVALLLVAACTTGLQDRIGTVHATGTAVVVAILDLNGDGLFEAGVDVPAPGIHVTLQGSSGDSVASAITRADGAAVMPGLPVGRYAVVVDSAGLGDTLRVSRQDSSHLTVVASTGDTAALVLFVSYPLATVAQARAATAGRKLVLKGIALSGQDALGNGTVVVSDTSGNIVAMRPGGSLPAVAGDSIRVIGTRAALNGQPILTDVGLAVLRHGLPPTPIQLTTGQAARAQAGKLDAALVDIDTAIVLESHTDAGVQIVTIDDGSGPLEVAFTGLPSTGGQPLPGARLSVTGILMAKPNAPGVWRLWPRTQADLVDLGFPFVTIADARTQPVGNTITVLGIALNGTATFSDGSLHIQDPTAAIRILGLRSQIVLAGDSIRTVGTVYIGTGGQPYLAPVSVTRLKQGVSLPAPTPLFTGTAATANGGRLDAQQVKLTAAVVKDTSTTSGAFVMSVDDGSGMVKVVLDPTTGLLRPGLIPGARLDVTGLLVPTGPGVWVVKPRTAPDLSITG